MIWWGIFAAVLSFVFSFWIKNLAISNKIGLAVPRQRDIHTKPIPRLGGVAIVASFLITMISIASFAPKDWSDFGFPFAVLGVSIDKRLLGILLATILMSIVMIIDDIRGVKAYLKLLTQILVALILIVAGIGLVYLNNPLGNTIYLDTIKYAFSFGGEIYHFVLWADLFFIFWVLLISNSTNFIDGLDGLAGSLSLISGIILTLLSISIGQYSTALLCIVFCGAILGFLPLNWPRAKMFLGDTGSMFLGLILSVLTIITGGKLGTVLLVFGLVILDSIYVVVKRIIRGQNPLTTPDQSHIHHRFLSAGFSRIQTLLTISVISLAFGLCGVYLEGMTKIYLILLLIVFSFGLFLFLDVKSKHRKIINLKNGN